MKFRLNSVVAVLAAAMLPGMAHASKTGFQIFGGDFSYNGLIRVETAFSTSGQTSRVNQHGDPANGVPIRREAGNPATGWTTTLTPGIVNSALLGGVQSVLESTNLLPTQITNLLGSVQVPSLAGGPPPLGVSNSIGTADTHTRYVPSRDQDLNYHIIRFEATPSLSWGSFALISRVRAVYDPGSLGYADFDMGDYSDINGGMTGGLSRQFHGKPDYFGYEVEGKKNPILFERSGKHYMVDLPAFFAQWTNGTTTVRVGNQSVAWGQLLFFRLMDVANGLDLRRHLFLDRAIEEYADERMSAPGVRVTVQATDQIVIDAFAQQFIPTVLMNLNTTYNIVASQFLLRDRYHENGYDDEINYGFRVKGEFGNYNAQFMFTSRLNQLGSIRWSKSGVNKALPNSNLLGAAFNQACAAALIPAWNLENGTSLPTNNGCGPLLAETPFEASPGGVFSAEEWFMYASYTKLHGNDGLDAAINDFPAAQQLTAQPVNGNTNAANNELDAFFMAAEGLHGHIERDYYREEVVGIGGGYVVEAEPGSILDQLIINFEATYTFGRTFTDIDLSHDYQKGDDMQVGLVMEKYQRFSQKFPATYMVFQYLWQKETDLAGLMLDGYGSENFSDQGVVLNPKVPTSANPKLAPGLSEGANYVVFAFLQPGEQYIFEYSIAALIDVQGGLLVQPAVQWKPRGNITFNLFYNYIESDAWGGNENKNLMSFIDFADEVGFRFGYQF